MLVAAYDDEAGVTAEFNKNVLAVLNAELGADFDLDAFEHVAVWNAGRGVDRDAAALGAGADRTVPGIGLTVELRRGRGDAHRDLGQVPPRGSGGRTGRRRVRDAVVVD